MANEPSAKYKAHMLEMLRTWPDRYVEYDGVPIEGYRVGRDTVEFVAWLADYVAKLEEVHRLWLCESRHLVLRPGERYVFAVDWGCRECVKIEREGRLHDVALDLGGDDGE